MRISDWSSDVCSSDLSGRAAGQGRLQVSFAVCSGAIPAVPERNPAILAAAAARPRPEFPAGVPMASYGMNDVKNGMKILVNGDPAIIVDTEYVKPGKGQAFTRVKYRMIKSGRVQEVTMKATDSMEAADVIDTDMQYLYSDGEYWHFMNPESFEQVQS